MLIDDLQAIFKQCFDTFTYDPASCAPAVYHWDTEKEMVAQLGDTGKVSGMCADFALYCRMVLDERGIDNTLLVCGDEIGEMHCVCNVGGYILDNRQTEVVTNSYLEKVGYVFLMESGTKAGQPWHLITH